MGILPRMDEPIFDPSDYATLPLMTLSAQIVLARTLVAAAPRKLPALAQQSANDIEMLTKHAGTWAVDCSKPGTRLGVDVKRLSLQSGGKQLASHAPPMAAFSYFGRQEPPAGFEVALLAGSVLILMIVELLNTGIETAIDRIGPEWHDLSKRAKDMGSAAVLLSLLLCIGIWCAALWHRFAA